MESNDIIIKLTNTINQLKQLNTTSLSIPQERSSEIEEKESVLISKIVGCFDDILLDNINIKKQKSPEQKDVKNHYWTYISKHLNTPVVRFTIAFDKSESNSTDTSEIYQQKGKNWILFSILEKSFADSLYLIYKQNLDTKYYDKNAILRENKSEIKEILKELNEVQFNNIKNKDYDKYKDFLKRNPNASFNEEGEIPQSPIISKKPGSQLLISEFSIIPLEVNNDPDPDDFNINDYIPDFKEEKEFTFTKFADFGPSIVNNFYTFVPATDNKNNDQEKNIINRDSNNMILSFSNINPIIDNEKNSDDEQDLSKNNEEDLFRLKSGLFLNPKISKHLPTDKLYEINEKTLTREYNKNDQLIYKKKKRPITNSILLYLNKYYQKALYHKFYKHNLNNRPITLKEQNYQCYICKKKISLIFGIPSEQVHWCSYYMRFVCKDCIDNELSIIPYFVLKKWCFEKFSISKKAKKILMKWYNKPIIYFEKSDKTDKLLKRIPQLNKVIEIKKVIHNIFDFMKCEKAFEFLEETLGEYDYLTLKEYIFSMRDLVEINNKTFYKKIVQFKSKFVAHLSGECPACFYEGEICSKCGFDEKIFFYDNNKVIYCKRCRKSFHKKCIGLIGHIHEHYY